MACSTALARSRGSRGKAPSCDVIALHRSRLWWSVRPGSSSRSVAIGVSRERCAARCSRETAAICGERRSAGSLWHSFHARRDGTLERERERRSSHSAKSFEDDFGDMLSRMFTEEEAPPAAHVARDRRRSAKGRGDRCHPLTSGAETPLASNITAGSAGWKHGPGTWCSDLAGLSGGGRCTRVESRHLRGVSRRARPHLRFGDGRRCHQPRHLRAWGARFAATPCVESASIAPPAWT